MPLFLHLLLCFWGEIPHKLYFSAHAWGILGFLSLPLPLFLPFTMLAGQNPSQTLLFCPRVGHFGFLVSAFALFSCLFLCLRGKIHTSSTFFCPRMGHFKLLVSAFAPNPFLTLLFLGQTSSQTLLFCPRMGHFKLLVSAFAPNPFLTLLFLGQISSQTLLFCPRMGHFKLLVSAFAPNPPRTCSLPPQAKNPYNFSFPSNAPAPLSAPSYHDTPLAKSQILS